eukprot:11134727-Alexandrium_andersonii.AAC.1
MARVLSAAFRYTRVANTAVVGRRTLLFKAVWECSDLLRSVVVHVRRLKFGVKRFQALQDVFGR